MKTRWIFAILIILSLQNVAVAYNPYGELYTYEVYYNGELLSGTEVAKPTLKIDEPFTVAIEMTMKQYCKVAVSLSELGSDNFIVLNGPSELSRSYDRIFIENETYKYEWTLKATEEWAGGAMPINFHYSILLPNDHETAVSSEFTIAVPYITTEYYEGDTTPTTATDPESPTSTDDPTTPSTPAFTLLAASLAIVIAAARRS